MKRLLIALALITAALKPSMAGDMHGGDSPAPAPAQHPKESDPIGQFHMTSALM